MIISSKELHDKLGNKNLVVIDTRSYKDYSNGHIPSAVNLDLFSLHWFDTSNEGIRSFELHMRKILSYVGVSSKNQVVFYDDVSGVNAARGVWILNYLSHYDTYMLDGGYRKWVHDGYEVDTVDNPFRPLAFDKDSDGVSKSNGGLGNKTNPDVLASAQYIRDNIDKLTIIDARTKEEFEGRIKRSARGGHIPGAVNINWEENLQNDGSVKDDKFLSKLYNRFSLDDEIVTYCHGGYRAANTYVVLKKFGFKNVKMYLGSWGEWGNEPSLPVE